MTPARKYITGTAALSRQMSQFITGNSALTARPSSQDSRGSGGKTSNIAGRSHIYNTPQVNICAYLSGLVRLVSTLNKHHAGALQHPKTTTRETG
jgi:hypothetical protein